MTPPCFCFSPARLCAAVVIACAVVAPELGAQRRYAAVTGFVTDTNGAAVPRVEVAILGSTEHRMFTDSAGRFRFASVGPGDRVLMARRIGFVARSFVVSLAAADTAQLVLELEPLAVELPDVVVSAMRQPSRFDEVRHRQAMGFGSFITRDFIDAKKPRKTSDLLRTQLGIEVADDLGRVSLFSTRGIEMSLTTTSASAEGQTTRGLSTDSSSAEATRNVGTQSMTNVNTRCRIPVVLDSHLMSEGFSLDDILPQEIETIEVYRGMATIPAQYLRYETRCGLVIVWTREGELRKRSPPRRE